METSLLEVIHRITVDNNIIGYTIEPLCDNEKKFNLIVEYAPKYVMPNYSGDYGSCKIGTSSDSWTDIKKFAEILDRKIDKEEEC